MTQVLALGFDGKISQEWFICCDEAIKYSYLDLYIVALEAATKRQ